MFLVISLGFGLPQSEIPRDTFPKIMEVCMLHFLAMSRLSGSYVFPGKHTYI